VDAVTVQFPPEPDTLEIDAVPDSAVWTSAKFALATPVTASLNVTVQDTDDAFVGEGPERLIEPTTGASVSNAYVCPATGTDPPSPLPTASWIVPLFDRLRPTAAVLLPTVPAVETVTVQVALGELPTGAAAVIVGPAPVVPSVAGLKFAIATFFTGSLNVTVQCRAVALVGLASARLIVDTVGAVVSTSHEYDAAELAFPPETACTWNVCEPSASPVYALGDEQALYDPLSSEHWYVTPDCESLNVKLIEVDVVGETDGVFPVIVGVGGADAARAENTPHAPATRTPSSATSQMWLALLPALVPLALLISFP
jgi:hypothetical protein